MKIKRNIQSAIFIVCATVFLALTNSCEKPNNELVMSGDLDFTYEEVPGFGNSSEPASGTTFHLPAGVELAGDIRGYDPYKHKELFNSENRETKLLSSPSVLSLTDNEQSLKNKASSADTIMGSGYFVEILVPLKNVTYSDIPTSFPAGLIFHAQSGDYQNGLLIKQVDINVPANATFNLVLQLYCCNVSRHASSEDAFFHNMIVSNHPVIMELCSLVTHKKVNIEDYYSSSYTNPYYDLRTTMQSLVWNISRGSSINSEDRDFINSIANE